MSTNKLKIFFLFLGDLAVFYLALILAILLRYGPENFTPVFLQHILPFGFIFIIWFFVLFVADFYQLRKIGTSINFYIRALKIILFNILLAVIFFYFVPYFEITPKRNLILFLAVFAPIFLSWRYLFQKLIAKSGGQALLLIGEDAEYEELINYLKNHPHLGYFAKYHLRLFDDGKISEIHSIITEEKIHTVIIPTRLKKNQALIDYFFKNTNLNVNIVDIPSFFEEMLKKIPVASLEESWFLENLMNNRKLAFEKSKRLFDILIALLASVIFLIFLPFIILAIKLGSKGPIFYKQKRIGKNGRIFELVKFRSMYAKSRDGGAENGKAVWAEINDPRVTNLGKILRKTHLDELPQLINILKGEMSIIGPRPERPEFEKELAEKIPYYNMRHLITPGVTGWAQINYPYGASIEDAKEKLEYDLFYLKNRSPFLDAVILFKTARIVLSREGR